MVVTVLVVGILDLPLSVVLGLTAWFRLLGIGVSSTGTFTATAMLLFSFYEFSLHVWMDKLKLTKSKMPLLSNLLNIFISK